MTNSLDTLLYLVDHAKLHRIGEEFQSLLIVASQPTLVLRKDDVSTFVQWAEHMDHCTIQALYDSMVQAIGILPGSKQPLMVTVATHLRLTGYVTLEQVRAEMAVLSGAPA